MRRWQTPRTRFISTPRRPAAVRPRIAPAAVQDVKRAKLPYIVILAHPTSGGVLAPLLMMGAALGGIEGMFLPHYGAGFWPLVSMAAVLAGAMLVAAPAGMALAAPPGPNDGVNGRTTLPHPAPVVESIQKSGDKYADWKWK